MGRSQERWIDISHTFSSAHFFKPTIIWNSTVFEAPKPVIILKTQRVPGRCQPKFKLDGFQSNFSKMAYPITIKQIKNWLKNWNVTKKNTNHVSTQIFSYCTRLIVNLFIIDWSFLIQILLYRAVFVLFPIKNDKSKRNEKWVCLSWAL